MIPKTISVGPLKLSRAFLFSGIKYVIVGTSTFILDYVLNWLFIIMLKVDYLLVGYIVAPFVLGFNFTAHKLWSFAGVRTKESKTELQIVRYLLLVAFNAVMNMVLMYLFYGTWELPLLWARIVCVLIGIIWNYPVFKFWVYK